MNVFFLLASLVSPLLAEEEGLHSLKQCKELDLCLDEILADMEKELLLQKAKIEEEPSSPVKSDEVFLLKKIEP